MAQQDIEMILIRQWASYLTLPVFLVDREGNLLFYNEPAEALIGRRYDEAGLMPAAELGTIFETTTEDGQPVRSESLPLAMALMSGRPAHARVRFKALDGHFRTIEVTAFPVEGQGERHLGAVAIFWEAGEA